MKTVFSDLDFEIIRELYNDFAYLNGHSLIHSRDEMDDWNNNGMVDMDNSEIVTMVARSVQHGSFDWRDPYYFVYGDPDNVRITSGEDIRVLINRYPETSWKEFVEWTIANRSLNPARV